MSRPRTRAIKPIERDTTGVVLSASAFDSLMANDAAWRTLLRMPVGYSIKRVEDGWIVFDDEGGIVFEWATLDVAIQEATGYDE